MTTAEKPSPRHGGSLAFSFSRSIRWWRETSDAITTQLKSTRRAGSRFLILTHLHLLVEKTSDAMHGHRFNPIVAKQLFIPPLLHHRHRHGNLQPLATTFLCNYPTSSSSSLVGIPTQLVITAILHHHHHRNIHLPSPHSSAIHHHHHHHHRGNFHPAACNHSSSGLDWSLRGYTGGTPPAATTSAPEAVSAPAAPAP